MDRRLLVRHTLAIAAFLLCSGGGQTAMAQDFKSAAECVVGKRVVTREKQAGVIVKVEGSGCTVKLDATGSTDYNIFWMLRSEGAGNTSSAEALPNGKYSCYMLAGTVLTYMNIDIYIESRNRYRDGTGQSGTYSIGKDQRIYFTGPLAKARGKLSSGPRISLNMNGGTVFNTDCSK